MTDMPYGSVWRHKERTGLIFMAIAKGDDRVSVVIVATGKAWPEPSEIGMVYDYLLRYRKYWERIE